MSDFERPSGQNKAMLQIMMDGHVEACVHAAEHMNIGIGEAMDLAAMAILREFAARQFDRAATSGILDDALDQTYSLSIEERPRRVS